MQLLAHRIPAEVVHCGQDYTFALLLQTLKLNFR